MNEFKIVSLLLGLFVCRIPSSNGVSVSCMMVYDEGGAAAVFRSPECPDWKPIHNQTLNCQFATIRGWREYQEDRISCDLDMKIPLLDEGKREPREMRVGVVGVFDGHGGEEASDMASKLFMDYFLLHTIFNIYKKMIAFNKEQDTDLQSKEGDESLQMKILREALLRTIHEIDLKFSEEAVQSNLHAGSTATVVVIIDGQILVGNVGDSKALLCSEKKSKSHQVTQGRIYFSAQELTRDHHPDREDERARIEASGGSIIVWGVPRVNGILAMSRSIGDVYLKRHGVISTPELTGWRALTANDSYLVVASDGIFESLTPDDICDFIGHQKSGLSSSSSLADCIVDIAFEKGSTDNLSVIVVPLISK
ncbi:probable protein phosphatase 2C 51 isoform X1 [Vitis vinifera]|uniref:protein-serine/threonine phosphatase n=1 Tax=Vitis vinifera TaxID=29760 RepID=D7T3F9_VITVI|eukprot:XP_010646118.1 PREDICTED: probable protein phosphatase 2C 51 isoform X1 [Vitis vinifera]